MKKRSRGDIPSRLDRVKGEMRMIFKLKREKIQEIICNYVCGIVPPEMKVFGVNDRGQYTAIYSDGKSIRVDVFRSLDAALDWLQNVV